MMHVSHTENHCYKLTVAKRSTLLLQVNVYMYIYVYLYVYVYMYIARIVGFCVFWGSKCCPIEAYVYSGIMLGHGSYIGSLSVPCTQQQLRYDAAQILRAVATSQLLVLIFVCFGTCIMLCYLQKVASCFVRGMRTL